MIRIEHGNLCHFESHMMTFEYRSSDKIDELPEWSDNYSYSRKTQGEAHSCLYVISILCVQNTIHS